MHCLGEAVPYDTSVTDSGTVVLVGSIAVGAVEPHSALCDTSCAIDRHVM